MENNNNNNNNNSNNSGNNVEKKSFAKAFAEGWKRMSAGRKALTFAGFILSLAVIILAALSLFGVWEGAGMIYIPLLGALMFTQAAQVWKINKKSACISLAAGAVILVFWVIGMFVAK